MNKALEGERISPEEARELFKKADLLELAYVANEKRKSLHPDSKPVTYVVQRNINYSNVCTAHCSFCAFYTPPGIEEGVGNFPKAYVLDYETEMKPKIQELVDIGGTEIFLQIKKDFPNVTLHALSPSEVQHIAEKHFTPVGLYGDGTNSGSIIEPSLEEIKFVLEALKDAGKDALAKVQEEYLEKYKAQIKSQIEEYTKELVALMKKADPDADDEAIKAQVSPIIMNAFTEPLTESIKGGNRMRLTEAKKARAQRRRQRRR